MPSLKSQARGSSSTPSVTPSLASHAARTLVSIILSTAGLTSGGVSTAGLGNAALMFLRKAIPMSVKLYAGAPATIPSKSSGYRCASIIAWRPPFEQPRK